MQETLVEEQSGDDSDSGSPPARGSGDAKLPDSKGPPKASEGRQDNAQASGHLSPSRLKRSTAQESTTTRTGSD